MKAEDEGSRKSGYVPPCMELRIDLVARQGWQDKQGLILEWPMIGVSTTSMADQSFG